MAAKKRKPVQEALLGVDTRPREPTRVEHRTDFSAMAVGVCVGNDRVTIRCPVCFDICFADRTPLKWRFVHSAVFVATEKTTRCRPSRKCELDASIVTEMSCEREPALRMKNGVIVLVEQHAPQRVEALLAYQEQRRKITEAKPHAKVGA